MDAFLNSQKSEFVRPGGLARDGHTSNGQPSTAPSFDHDEESTDIKLAILASLHPSVTQDTLLDMLILQDGSVEAVTRHLGSQSVATSSRKRPSAAVGYQSSLSSFRTYPPRQGDPHVASPTSAKRRALTRKGQTLHLYDPDDVAKHTPCSIIHNFLPAEQAEHLLTELLAEAPTFERSTFKLFDNVVTSPHTACFYVQSLEEERKQKTEYLYNGSFLNVCY